MGRLGGDYGSIIMERQRETHTGSITDLFGGKYTCRITDRLCSVDTGSTVLRMGVPIEVIRRKTAKRPYWQCYGDIGRRLIGSILVR
jgi:hypothetical protein